MAQHSSLVKALVASASIVIVLAGIKAASEIVVPFLLALFIAGIFDQKKSALLAGDYHVIIVDFRDLFLSFRAY